MLLPVCEVRSISHFRCCCAGVQIIARLGEAINHPDSVYYWAWKNSIPVFCPAITDGSIGETTACHHLRTVLPARCRCTLQA
jgi:deoxyhypusine synthase